MIQSADGSCGNAVFCKQEERGTCSPVIFHEMSVFFIKTRKINLHKIKTVVILCVREFLQSQLFGVFYDL